MITGYKLKPESMRVNSRIKANKIIQDLRWQGRHAFYEPVAAGPVRKHYCIFYWPIKGVI